MQVCPRLCTRFTSGIGESQCALYLLRLGRLGKESYARVLLHLLLTGVETVPVQSERESKVRVRTGHRQGATLYMCEYERHAREGVTKFGTSIQVVVGGALRV